MGFAGATAWRSEAITRVVGLHGAQVRARCLDAVGVSDLAKHLPSSLLEGGDVS
jgi:hypothetical protein